MKLLDEFSETELKLMGLDKLIWWNIHPLSWDWTRGQKTKRYYTVGSSAVEADRRALVEWSYVMDAGNRNIVTPSRSLTLFDDDGVTPILGPQDISKPFNLVDLDILNMDVRIKRIANLRKNAENVAGGAGLVASLYAWYGAEISHYETPEGGDDTLLEDKLKAETDPTRLGTLNYQIPEFQNLTIMQMLAYQLVGTYGWS